MRWLPRQRGPCSICAARANLSISGMWHRAASGESCPQVVAWPARPALRAVSPPWAASPSWSKLVQDASIGGVVIDDEHRQAVKWGAGWPAGLRRAWQPKGREVEGAALADFALHPDPPPHQFDQLLEMVRPSPVPPYGGVVAHRTG